MRRRRHSLALLAGLVLFLGAMNYQILAKERILAQGTIMLAPLRPVDPRAFMRGDYMALGYDRQGLPEDLPIDGRLVVRLDENGVIQPQRLHDGGPLAEDEHLLTYRLRGHDGRILRLGPTAFFMEEGQGPAYAQAEFAVLRVAADGTSVLVGLADAEGRMLGRGSP